MNLVKKIVISLFLYGIYMQASLAGVDEDVFQLKKTWEQLKYKTPLSEQEKGFELLLNQSEKVTAKYPGKAEPRYICRGPQWNTRSIGSIIISERCKTTF